MNPEVKAKWVAALRSGRYQQIEGQLTNGAAGFCCLGVLCDISRLGRWCEDEGDQATKYKIGRDSDEGLPLMQVADWAGFVPHLPYPTVGARIPYVVIEGDKLRLDEHNDSGKTFAQIADAIEEQL